MIDVFDAAGALVTRLDGGIEPAGAHAIKWDGRDRAGKGVASGVYFYRLDGMPEVEARRMVLLK
jgi:flagellar hook assembly protein FlgD